MNLSERIAEALREANLNQSDLARVIGISSVAVNNWVTGATKSIKGDNLLKAASALKVRPEWLSSGKGAMRSSGNDAPDSNVQGTPRAILAWSDEEELGEQYVFLPRLTLEASCGRGKAVWEIEEKGQRQAFRAEWAKRLGIDPERSATIIATGDSMEPRIMDADSLVIDYKATTIVSGKVYLIAIDGEFMVKRLFREPGGRVRVVSDNPRYPETMINPEDAESLQIIGRVVAVSGGM